MTEPTTEHDRPDDDSGHEPQEQAEAARQRADAEAAAAAYAANAPDTEDATELAEGEGQHAATLEQRAAEDPRSREELLAALDEAQFGLIAAAAERDDLSDQLLRKQAEFENFRKRKTKESVEARGAGVGDLASALLEVLDDLDAALANMPDDEPMANGVRLVRDKFLTALTAKGVERIDQPGVAFDPTMHDAVSQVPASEDQPADTVAQVFRPGYRIGDRVLRAAMVVVAQ